MARKLTPAEKKEKKLKKLVGEANEGDAPQMAVYRVSDLTNRQHQFKVRVNAQVGSLRLCCVALQQSTRSDCVAQAVEKTQVAV